MHGWRSQISGFINERKALILYENNACCSLGPSSSFLYSLPQGFGYSIYLTVSIVTFYFMSLSTTNKSLHLSHLSSSFTCRYRSNLH